MSAYGHQMDQEDSSQSLLSRGGSEIGSRYTIESGIYISSFAAAIFVSALVSIGVLLITMLIALTVMLQSCQNKNAGVVELQKSIDDYNHCKVFALHAELNSLDAGSIPSICRRVAVQYIKDGQYMRDLNTTVLLAENHFKRERPRANGLDVLLMDMDDIIPSNSCVATLLKQSDCVEEAKHLKRMFCLRLYMKLHVGGWPLILFSRKPEKQRSTTLEHLISAGFANWSSVIMRISANPFSSIYHSARCSDSVQDTSPEADKLDEELAMSSSEYLSRQRNILKRRGFHIRAVVSSQMDALTGPVQGSHIFKIPNPI